MTLFRRVPTPRLASSRQAGRMTWQCFRLLRQLTHRSARPYAPCPSSMRSSSAGRWSPITIEGRRRSCFHLGAEVRLTGARSDMSSRLAFWSSLPKPVPSVLVVAAATPTLAALSLTDPRLQLTSYSIWPLPMRPCAPSAVPCLGTPISRLRFASCALILWLFLQRLRLLLHGACSRKPRITSGARAIPGLFACFWTRRSLDRSALPAK